MFSLESLPERDIFLGGGDRLWREGGRREGGEEREGEGGRRGGGRGGEGGRGRDTTNIHTLNYSWCMLLYKLYTHTHTRTHHNVYTIYEE